MQCSTLHLEGRLRSVRQTGNEIQYTVHFGGERARGPVTGKFFVSHIYKYAVFDI